MPPVLTKSEQRFIDYLESEGYTWEHEPDYQEALGLVDPLDQRPDFLISRGGQRAICEVRQFDLGDVDKKLADMKTGVLSEKDVYGRARFALVEKAEQLEPLAGCGVPLVIVLSNPLGVFVPLDTQHMISVIFGNPKWSIPIEVKGGGPAGPGSFIVRDYGAFFSLLRDERGERFVRRHPHVSAVVTLHYRTNEQDFIDQVMARHPSADDTFDAAATAAVAALQEINQARASGLIPEGKYQWLEVYELDGDAATPLPRSVLTGPRDRRHGYVADDRYGELS